MGNNETINVVGNISISPLVKIVESSGLEQSKAQYILDKFADYFQVASAWESKAKMCAVTSEHQIAEMKMAREGRLFLKSKRVDIEKGRKELKEQCLREGKAIDGIANVLKALIEPLEEYLEQQERFIEIKEEKAGLIRLEARELEFRKLGVDPAIFFGLENMKEEEYQSILNGRRALISAQIEAEKKAEEERIAKEKEQARIKAENERLKAEAKEKERLIAEERAKVKAEREAQERKIAEEKELALKIAQQEQKILEKKIARDREETDRKLKEAQAELEKLEIKRKEQLKKERAEKDAEIQRLRDENEAKFKKQNEERRQLEAELKAKKDTEEAKERLIEQAKEAASKATDEEKLLGFAEGIELVDIEVTSEWGKKISEHVFNMLGEIAKYIRVRIEDKKRRGKDKNTMT